MANPAPHNLFAVLGETGSPRQRTVRRRVPAVPLLLSAAIHIAIISAAALVVWRTAMSPGPGAGGGAGVTFEAGVDAARSAAPASAPAAVATDASTSEGSLAPLFADTEPDSALSGLATAAPAGVEGPTAGAVGSLAGSSLASSSLFSDAGSAAPTGARAGAAAGTPSVTFGGLGASRVSSVVYAVDCSGPMVTSLPMVIAELERSVSRLTPGQKFGVVLFRKPADGVAGPGVDVFAPALVRATQNAKGMLHNWLVAAEPAGRSSPLAGVEAALALKPDAVFLLSRAIQRSGGGVWEQGLDATMARLEQLNPERQPLVGAGRGVLIQTIQFLEEDPTGVMQAIGQRHGGGSGYRVVTRQQDLSAPALPAP